ncbi:MAG: chemotaxis protein CheA, partial [Nitrospirota bacterium]|nr:chemotaxis protein CheA [Nitrospirota bacterium]
VDTALIVNKLALTMDAADDLKDLMPAGPKVSSPAPDLLASAADAAQPTEGVSSATGESSGETVEESDVDVEASLVPDTVQDVPESVPALSDVLSKMQEAASRTAQAASTGSAKPAGKEEDSTVRVETRRLDHVMNLVGELVLGRNRLMKLGNGLEEEFETNPLVRELAVAFAQLNLVTSDLQLAVMKTRMVPIRKVFSRFPRLVRDLSSKLGKQVRLELIGEDTEVDKSVADELGDPLVHLVRNSMDHGLETIEERKRTGKSPEGSVRLAAYHEGNSIVIRIEDDGRGLQVDKIAKSALSKGLITESELSGMSPRDVMKLIFLPGFSTAEQVSDLSGRGVGMDVVRTNISRMNGSLELDSELGRGSQVTIKLPLTVAIIQALLVEVGSSTFAVPLASVVEAVKVTKGDIKSVNGQAVLNLRERILPLLDLAQTFGVPNERQNNECYVVVVAIGAQRFGVVVDRLRAQEEVVIKSLGNFLSNVSGVAGATITGDGKVVLILDMSDLVKDVPSTSFASI